MTTLEDRQSALIDEWNKRAVELIHGRDAMRADRDRLAGLCRELLADWDDHFDAEGPSEDCGGRWSSYVAAALIEKIRAALAQKG